MNKELEALEDIILHLNANEPKGLYCKNIEILKTALKENSKKLKALEIIKELFIFQPDKFCPFMWKDLTKTADKEKLTVVKEVLK